MTDSFVSGEPGTKKVSDIVKLTPLFKVILSPKAAIASQLVYIFSRKVAAKNTKSIFYAQDKSVHCHLMNL